MADRKAVVVGAGIVGVLTARELLLAGWDVVLTEATHPGAGSSSRSAAGMRQQFSTPGTVRGMRYSRGFYERFGEETEDGISPLVQNGYLFLYDTEPGFERACKRVRMQQDEGLTEVEALDNAALNARFPFVRDNLVGATWCPTDGFLRPHVIYNDGADRVRALGGTLLLNNPVTGARSEGGRIVALESPKAVLEADLFVDCTNAWTRRLAGLIGAMALPVEPLKRYLWFLKREGSMSREMLAGMPLVICPNGTYVRPENADTLLMGRIHDAPPSWDFTDEDQDRIEDAYSHDGDLDAFPFQLWAELSEDLPATAEFGGIQATSGGFYATTPDHNPFLAYDPQLSNLIHLVGFSGHGVMMAPFTAKVATAMAEAGTDLDSIPLDGAEVDLTCFQIGRSYAHAEEMVI